MSTLSLYETIQRIVQAELRRVHTAELAAVQEQHSHAEASDQDNYSCTVKLRNSGLVLKAVPVATPRIGQVSIPAVGDLVLVQFVGGDINAPIIVGSLYNDADRPPANANGQSILHLPFDGGDSDAVHIEVNSDGKREINIKLGSGVEINLRDDDPAVKIAVGSSATVQIDSDGAINLESQGKIAIKGNEITIEAQAQLKLKGATIDLN
jgi:uncharacterized protein involved in type VI secretion and phage assembly